MGVDSCGYVWKDAENAGQLEDGQQTEIKIVVWSGLPPTQEQDPSSCGDPTNYNCK